MVRLSLFNEITPFMLLITSLVFGLTPIFYSIRNYYRTRIREYLIFAFFWFFASLTGIISPLMQNNDLITYLQIFESSILWFLFLMLYYALRIINFTSNKIYYFWLMVGLGYTLFLQIVVFLWIPFMQETATVLLWKLEANPIYLGNGAGYRIGTTVIYSNAHTLLRDILGFTAGLTFMYAHWTVTLYKPTREINIAHKLWKIASIGILLIPIFSGWIWRFTSLSPNLSIVPIFLVSFIVALITIFFPNGFILSKTQHLRILSLYEALNILNFDGDLGRNLKDPTIQPTEYLRALRKAIDRPLMSKKDEKDRTKF